jgi:Bacterial membrane protein YfhO
VSIPFPAVRENAGMHYGWSTFTGYVGLWLGRTWDYVHMAVGLQVPTTSVAFPASNVYRSAFPYDGVSLVLGFEPGTGRGGLRAQVDPRAYVVDAAVVVPDWRAAIEAMAQGHDYHRVALVEEPVPNLSRGNGGGPGQARIVSFALERIELETHRESPGLLVMAESYYPGWTATVNGEPIPCLPANGWMRAVPVPAGDSRVVLIFQSNYLAAGAGVSALALVLLLLLASSGRRAERKPVRG